MKTFVRISQDSRKIYFFVFNKKLRGMITHCGDASLHEPSDSVVLM